MNLGAVLLKSGWPSAMTRMVTGSPGFRFEREKNVSSVTVVCCTPVPMLYSTVYLHGANSEKVGAPEEVGWRSEHVW